MRGDYLGQAAFRLEVVPARVAYLIAPRSEGGFRQAVREASTRWAGVTEPIIPVWRNGRVLPWWSQVLELLQIDALVRVDADLQASARVAHRVGLPLIELADIDRAGPSRWTCNPVFVNIPRDPRFMSGAVLASDPASLWQVTACGDLTDDAFDAMSEHMGFNRSMPSDQVGRAQLRGETLLDLTTTQFSENAAEGGLTVCPTIVWVTAKKPFLDCLFYWNLRALRSLTFEQTPMLLVPVDAVENWLGFDRELAGQLNRPADLDPDVLIVGSVSNAERHRVAEVLGLKLSTGDIRTGTGFPPPPPRTPPFTYRINIEPRQFFIFERQYGEWTETIGQLFRDETQLDFDSAVTFRGNGSTLLRLSSRALDAYPRRNEIADLIQSNAQWQRDRLQIATMALDRYRISIQLPERADVLNTILQRNGVTHTLSEKGLLARSLSLQLDIDELLRPSVYEVVVELTTPRTKELRRELERQADSGARRAELLEIAAHWGGRRERRYRTAEELRSRAGPASLEALERLAAIGWIERGLQIRCEQCGVTSFVPLASANWYAAVPGLREQSEIRN